MKKYKLDSEFENIRHIDVGPRGISVFYDDGSHRFVRQSDEGYYALMEYAKSLMPKPEPQQQTSRWSW